MSCSHIPTCALFPQFKLRQALRVWQLSYCETDKHKQCSRFLAATACEAVPITLLPNGKHMHIVADTPK